MWNWRYILNVQHIKTVCLHCTHRTLTTHTNSLHKHIHILGSKGHQFFSCGLNYNSCRIWRCFFRSLETTLPCALPRQHISRWICERHDRVVITCLNKHIAKRHCLRNLLLALFNCFLRFSHTITSTCPSAFYQNPWLRAYFREPFGYLFLCADRAPEDFSHDAFRGST